MDSYLFGLLKLFIENGSMTMQEIEAYSNISAKTANKRIAEINSILGKSAHISAGIERFQLIINDYSKFLDIETQFLKGELDLNDPVKRKALIIDILIKNKNFISIDDIADKVTVSRKVINKDLKQIRASLSSYKGEIESKTGKGIKVSFASNFDEICALRNFVINHTSKSSWLSFTTTFSETVKSLEVSKEAHHQILNNILAVKVFKNYGYTLQQLPEHYYPLWDETSTISNLISELKETIKDITKAEIKFILSPLDLSKNNYLNLASVEQAFHHNYELLFVPFKSTLLQYGLNAQTVYERIKWHLLFSINRTLLYTKIIEVLPRNISDNYPIALEFSLKLADRINTQFAVCLSKNELNYYVVYFEMFLEEISEDTKEQVRVAFVGSIRSSVKGFIENKLLNVFENLRTYSFANVTEFKKANDKFLLVFVDKPLKIKDVQVVNVGTAFRPEALSIIMQISVIEQLIKQGKIILSVEHLEAEDYYDAVDKMIDHQVQKGQLTPDFKRTWIEREKDTNNIFTNGIAIPHAIDYSNKERILVSVGIIDNKISFKKNELKLIFLIGIPNSLNKELIDATSRLYDFIGLISRNEILYDNIAQYDDSKQLIQIAEGV